MTNEEFQRQFKNVIRSNKVPTVCDLVTFLQDNFGNDCCLNIFVNSCYEYVATNLKKKGIQKYINRRMEKCIYYHNATIDDRPIIEIYTRTIKV